MTIRQQEFLGDVLTEYMQHADISLTRLANKAGVARRTLYYWLDRSTVTPSKWQPLVRVAAALGLSEVETNRLLRAAGFSSLHVLRQSAEAADDSALLATWQSAYIPFQAPSITPHFIARERTILAITAALLADSNRLVHLWGIGGVGKTTLASHVATKLQTHFADGVLWVNLQDADLPSVLTSLASSLGHSVAPLQSRRQRLELVRGVLAGRKILLVLDNVVDDIILEHLLPTLDQAAVLVTSRRGDLWSLRHANRIQLTGFNAANNGSIKLFQKVLGQRFVDTHAIQLLQLADRLGHLPLAIDIIASRLQHGIGLSREAQIDYLLNDAQLLVQLKYGQTSVQKLLASSEAQLSAEQKMAWAAMSVFAGKPFPLAALAAILFVSTAAAAELVGSLYNFALIQQVQTGRFVLHPLVQAYCAERLSKPDIYRERMVAYYVAYMQTYEARILKLDEESDGVLLALESAATLSDPAWLADGMAAAERWLRIHGQLPLALKWLELAESRLRGRGDDLYRLATVLSHKLSVWHSMGEFDKFAAAEAELLALVDKTENYVARLIWMNKRSGQLRLLGRLHESIAMKREMEVLAIETGNTQYAMMAAFNQTVAYSTMMEPQLLLAALERSRKLAEQIQDIHSLVVIMTMQGAVDIDLGDFHRARDVLYETLALAGQISADYSKAGVYSRLSWVYRQLSQPDRALQYAEQAIAITHLHPENYRHVNSLLTAGHSHIALGQFDKAAQRFDEAMAHTDSNMLSRLVVRRARVWMHLKMGELDIAYAMCRFVLDELKIDEHAEIWIDSALVYGEILLARRQSADALETFEYILTVKTWPLQTWRARYGKGRALALLGDMAAARQIADQCLGFFKQNRCIQSEEYFMWTQSLADPINNH